MQQNFEKAAEYFDLTYNLSTDENVKTELIYKKTSCLLLSHNYKYALVELLNLSENTTGQLSRRRNFYLGMTYFGMNNFKEAEKAFIASIDSLNHQKEQLKIREIFIAVKKVDRINPKTAKILSVLIPGLGQIYAGDIRNGLNSLAITSAFVYMAYAISIKSTYIDGILTAMPWYQRYYMGGYARAEKITIARKNEKFNRCYERILDSIIETLD
jgi:TM2 domain-containing membrane protein YozV